MFLVTNLVIMLLLYMYTIICSGVSPPLWLSTSVMVHLFSSLKQFSGIDQGVARDGLRMGSGMSGPDFE